MILSLLLSLAPLGPIPQEEATSPEVLFSMTGAVIDSYFVDSKDANLLLALKMIDDRLLELPGEIPDMDVPPGVLELATQLFGGDMSMTVALGGQPIEGMPLPIMVDLSLGQGTSSDAESVALGILEFMDMMGMPAPEPVEGELLALPAPVPVWMGPVGSDFVVRLGNADGLETPAAPAILPEGVATTSSGMLEYGKLIEMALTMAGSEDVELGEMLKLFAKVGMTDLKYEWAGGFDSERQYSAMNVPGWAANMRELGVIAEGDLGSDFLRTIPVDATWASAIMFDLTGIFRFYDEMLVGMGMDMIGDIEAEIGMSIEGDILAALGQRISLYCSDTTGGGGMTSMIGVMELGDRDKFLRLFGRLEQLVNQAGAREANGYVRLEQRGDFFTLAFPGLPVPMELTLAITESHAVLGMSPQAVSAAVGQLSSPASSLLDNASFKDQAFDPGGDLMAMTWINTPRLMNDGYGTVGMLTSALANAVRSPGDETRQPGVLMPSYSALMKDAKGILMVSVVRGDDYLTLSRSDRSHLVNAAGVSGFVYNSPLMYMVPMVMGMVRTASTAESFVTVPRPIYDAEYAQADSDIATLYQALEMYALKNEGVYPETLEELEAVDASGNSYLYPGTALIDPWGEPYYYIAPYEDGDYPYIFSSTNDSAWEYGSEYEYGYEYGEMGYEYYDAEEPQEEILEEEIITED
jgi:hypothetical protein